MAQEIFIVDAFTSEAFKGNPAAVCIVQNFPSDAQMQQIAMEMNLSETAFAKKLSEKHYHLRWFTPAAEVNLCGHATLATTHVLQQTGALNIGDTVRFDTLSGELSASVSATNITLDFPTLAGTQCAPHAALAGLGVEILNCERNRDNYLVEVRDMATLLACTPDMRVLGSLDQQGVILTTATGTGHYDFASRYFAPNCGVDEDPVTGSAHCFLAPYWAARLNKTQFRALQASKREGFLDVTLNGERVLIAGQAVTTLRGELAVTCLQASQLEAA